MILFVRKKNYTLKILTETFGIEYNAVKNTYLFNN